MSKDGKATSHFPSKAEILAFVEETPGKVGKREIARAFRLGPADKPRLRALLREMADEGLLERGHRRRFGPPGRLPEVSVVEISEIDTDGELIARPLGWREDGPPPRIFVAPDRNARPALAPGDKVLVRLSPTAERTYEARPIRRVGSGPAQVVGVLIKVAGHVRLKPADRKHKSEFFVTPADTQGAEVGDLVRADVVPARRQGMRQAKVVEAYGPMGAARTVSMVAILDNDIPLEFPIEADAQAEAAGPAPLGKRADLRKLPLVTIDGADARDFDDAVFAEPWKEDGTVKGWHAVVAIADVAWYVRPGDALDKEAFKRGNSVYFPDRVVPMLPEALSNGWCSLRPEEERPCLAAHLWIDNDGTLKSHRFERGLMRSAARLTYEQVQAAREGDADGMTEPLLGRVIDPLYGVFEALSRNREARGVLDLDLAESRVVIGEDGAVQGVETRQRLDSHRLIEELMITANVAAAETLEARKMPCMYRVHDAPSPEKLDALRDFLSTLDIKLPRGQTLQPRHFNRILAKVEGTAHQQLVNEVVLRSQAQAAYSPDNLGHFGLALRRYAHFTSPIRRYADLLVHRALVRALGLGDGALPDEPGDFEEIGAHISATERRAQKAERDSVDRFTALYLAERVGRVFEGRVTGVTRFGLFVTLEGTGADGLVPIRSLPDDYYDHDETHHSLIGRRTGTTYRLGDTVEAMLMEADPITGSMVLQLTDAGAGPRRSDRRGRAGRPLGRGKRGKRAKRT